MISMQSATNNINMNQMKIKSHFKNSRFIKMIE